MNMTPNRRLSEAVGSWLHLEYCCNRAKMFGEDSLKASVGQVLSAFATTGLGALVHAGYKHPAIAKQPGSKGAPRRIDFAVFLDKKDGTQPKVEIAVEAKWAGSSHCTPVQIVTDLVRLAMIKEADNATCCIFLLAGSARNLATLLEEPIFKGAAGRKGRIGKDYMSALDLTTLPADIYTPNDLVPKAKKIRVRGADLHPKNATANQYDFQAIAWQIG